MCGIIGSVNFPISFETVNSLQHRGPDGSGLVSVQMGQMHTQLGHTRLAIQDLSSAAHQPMQSSSGTGLIVFNGEIYNHRELRQRLNGLAWRGSGDTETLVELLRADGTDALDSLNGIFALAFFDRDREKLFLARDPFGVKPLYYWTDGYGLMFASEIHPIQTLVRDAVDEQNLSALLQLRFLPSPNTLYRNIRKVQPGHLVEVSLRNGRLVVDERQYGCRERSIFAGTYKDAVAEYDKKLHDAVRRQLLSDVDVGVFLSGGVDSALIASIARNELPYQLRSFTAGFAGGHQFDETAYAAASAHHLRIPNESTLITGDAAIQSLIDTIRRVEEPIATSSIIPMHFLAELASRKVKVVLSGQGADEIWGGYRRYKAPLVRDLFPGSSLGWLQRHLPFNAASGQVLHRGLGALSASNVVDSFVHAYAVFGSEDAGHLSGAGSDRGVVEALIKRNLDLVRNGVRDSEVELMMGIDRRMGLADDLLMYTDKLTMSHSMECRVPYLDRELVEFVNSLPTSYKLTLHQSKRVHRSVARHLLPSKIVRAKKLGFESPIRDWLRSSQHVKDMIFGGYFARNQESRRVLERTWSDFMAGKNKARQMFLLLSITAWFDSTVTNQREMDAQTAYRRFA